jgi:autotransporter-associated beta strand protein
MNEKSTAGSFVGASRIALFVVCLPLCPPGAAGGAVVTVSETGSVIDSRGMTLNWSTAPYGIAINGESFETNTITTCDGYQYSAYWVDDTSSGTAAYYLAVARRSVGSSNWQVVNLPNSKFANGLSSGYPSDAHNVVSLGIDQTDGTIDLAYDMHGNTLRYVGSLVGAASSSTWTASQFKAETSILSGGTSVTGVTYPMFVATPKGDLQLFYRNGSSGDGSWFVYDYSGSSHSWDSGHQIDNGTVGTYEGSTTRNAYPNGFTYDKNGQLNETFVWREGPGTSNHDINYVYSPDGGVTWKNNAGTVVSQEGSSTPTFSINSPGLIVAALSDSSSLMNQQAQNSDNEGNLHVIDYSLDPSKSPVAIARAGVPNGFDPQDCTYYTYWRDSLGDWHRDKIPGNISTIYSTRPKIYFDASDNAIALYGTGSSLVIAEASRASNWTDWQIVSTTSGTSSGGYFSEVAADPSQLATSGILTVVMQDSPTFSAGPSAIHAVDFSLALTPAGTMTFTGGSGNWSTASNWSGGGVPAGNNNASINAGQTVNFTPGTAAGVGGDVVLGTSAGGGSLNVSGGSLNVVGTISVGRDGGASGIYNQSGGSVASSRFVIGDFYSVASGGGASTATVSGGLLTTGELQIAVSDGTSSTNSALVVAGSASVVVNGDAIVGDCGNSGSLMLNGGTLTIAGRLMQGLNGTSTTNVLFNGGTLDMSGNSMAISQLVTNSGRLMNVMAINNGAALNLVTTGVFSLGGTNTFNNALNITSGTVRAESSQALGNGATTVYGGTATPVLQLAGGITLSGPITLAGRQPANLAAAIESVSGSNTITPPIATTIGGNQYNLQSDAGLLTVSGSFQNNQSGAGDVRYLNLMGNGNGLFSGVIADSSVTPNPSQTALVKTGSGMWTVTGINTYSGSTSIAGGTLSISSDAALGTPPAIPTANIVISNSATLAAAGTMYSWSAVNLSGNRNLVVNSGAVATLNTNGNTMIVGGAITGGGGLNKAGAGTLTLAGSNSYTGPTTIAAGTLLVSRAPAYALAPLAFTFSSGTDTNSGTTAVTLANGETSGAVAPVYSSTGGPVAGLGTMTLNGSNYLDIQAPSLPNLSGGSPNNYTIAMWIKTSEAGATFLYKGNGSWNAQGEQNFFLTNVTGNVNSGSGYAGGHVGGVQWSGGWIGGNTNVNTGTWQFISIVRSGGTSTLFVNGAANGSATNMGLGEQGTQDIRIGFNAGDTNDGAQMFVGQISGTYIYANALSASQIQALMAAGPNTTVTGVLSAASSVQLLGSGAALDINGTAQTIAALGGAAGSSVYLGGGTLTVGNSASTTYAGDISDRGGVGAGIGGELVKVGAGSLVLSGTNFYSGGTFVDAGTLVVDSVSALPNGSSLTVGLGASSLFAPVAETPRATAVPEPGTFMLLIAALWSAIGHRVLMVGHRFSIRRETDH